MDYSYCLVTSIGWHGTLMDSFWLHAREFILVVGLLGNVVNIIVFSHERMKSYVNSLFYWLAVFNSLVLTQIAIFSLIYGTEQATYVTSSVLFPVIPDSVLEYVSPSDKVYLNFHAVYILLSLHTVTVLLNIAIALWLYAARMYPQRLKAWRSSWSIKQTLMSAFVLGFALWIPHLFLMPKIIPSKNGDEGHSTFAPFPSSYKWITLINGLVVCISLLVVLLIICGALIIGLLRTRRGRREVIPDLVDEGIEGEGPVDQFSKEMANLTLPVAQIFIYLMVEVSIAAVPILSFMYSALPIAGGAQAEHHIFSFLCYHLFHAFLNGLVMFNFLVSSSYITFCYLTSAHYRLTLEMSLYSGYGRLKQLLKLGWYREVPTTGVTG